MVVQNVVKVLVDVIEHVHHFHGGTVLTDGSEPYNVTEVDGDFLVQLRLHEAFLLQRLDHQPRWRRKKQGLQFQYIPSSSTEIFETVLTVHQEFYNWGFPVSGVARNQRQLANTKSRNIVHTQSTCMWPQMNRRFSISLIPDYNSNKCECSVAQSCPTLRDPRDCSLPGSSVHGVFQARVLEWVAISFSRGFSPPRDRTPVSCIAGRRFTVWATREAPGV